MSSQLPLEYLNIVVYKHPLSSLRGFEFPEKTEQAPIPISQVPEKGRQVVPGRLSHRTAGHRPHEGPCLQLCVVAQNGCQCRRPHGQVYGMPGVATSCSLCPTSHMRGNQGPWSRLHINFAGLFQGQTFLVITDPFSRWLEVIPVLTMTTGSIVTILPRHFGTHEMPDTIVSDNGAKFTSEEFNALMRARLIHHTVRQLFTSQQMFNQSTWGTQQKNHCGVS